VLLGLSSSSSQLTQEVRRRLIDGRKYAVDVLELADPIREAVAIVEDSVDVSQWPMQVTDLADLLLLSPNEVPKFASVFQVRNSELPELCRPARSFFDKVAGYHCRPLLKGVYLKEELADPEFFFEQISAFASPFFDAYLMVEEQKVGRSEVLREKGNFFYAVAERLNRLTEIVALPVLRETLEVQEALAHDGNISQLILEAADVPMSFPTRSTCCEIFGLDEEREELLVFPEISAHPVHLWAQRSLGKTGDVDLPTFDSLTNEIRFLPNRKFGSLFAWLSKQVADGRHRLGDLQYLPTRELLRSIRKLCRDRKVAVTGSWSEGFAKQTGWVELPSHSRDAFTAELNKTKPDIVIVTGLPQGVDIITDVIRASRGVSGYLILGPKPGNGCPQKTWGERPWWASKKKFPLISPRNGFRLEEIPEIGSEVLCPEDCEGARFGGAWLWSRAGAPLLEGASISSLET
jgi:hypothetical protein